jgi:8-oxo-dGTP diphosphatase
VFDSHRGHMKQIQPVVVAVIKKLQGQYLVTKRIDDNAEFDGIWQFPGGGMEFAESPEETLIRECREEIGVEVIIDSLIPKIVTRIRGDWHGLLLGYLCHLSNQEDTIVLNEEASEFRWISIADLMNENITPFTKEVLSMLE